jgi:hypothetical protein
MKKSIEPVAAPPKKLGIPEKAKKKPVAEKPVMPEIIVNPTFELTVPAPDMAPVVDAVKQVLLASTIQPPNIDLHIDEDRKPRTVEVTITERDNRHLIKKFILKEVTDV